MGAPDLSITNGLSPLPVGWTSASLSFSCATVDGGAGCKLDLIYAPTVITASSTLALAYRYIDSAGSAQTATTGIAYAGNEASLFASALIS
ncbi:MAG: hypothetical protein V7642_3529 [Burkholderiales bacterium]|jgi:hypothetical protein